MNRKHRRALAKSTNQSAGEELSQKVHQFNQLPEQCMTCEKPFDKKNKEMLQSWSVVVRPETVRLFCPQCVKKTQEIIDEHSKT